MLTGVSGVVVDEFIDDEHILLFGGRGWDAELSRCFGCDVVEAIALSICSSREGYFVDPVRQFGGPMQGDVSRRIIAGQDKIRLGIKSKARNYQYSLAGRTTT
jgi:hypothetical protein